MLFQRPFLLSFSVRRNLSLALWLAVAATTWSFLGVDLIAGLLFLPYLVWVSVAGALNFSVMRRNPAAA